MALEIFRLVGSVFVDTDDADKSLKKSDKNAEGLGKRFLSVVQTAGKFAAGVVGACTAAGAAIVGLTENTREYRTEQGKLETAFTTNGFAAQNAKDTYIALNGVLGDSGQAVEASNHLAKLCDNAEELSAWTKICTGVYATFGASLPIEGLTEAANETAKVGQVTGPLADALNWAGVSEDAFNESLAACTSEQERQALITKTLNGLYSTAADKYREVNKEVIAANIANDKLASVMAEVGGAAEPLVTQGKTLIAEVLTKAIPYVELLATVWIPALIEMITNCCTWIGENGATIEKWTGYVVAASASVASFLVYMNWGNIMNAASTALNGVTSSVKLLNLAVSKNKIAIVVSAIVGLITWLVYLYNTNEKFRMKVNEVATFVWAKLQAVFGWLQAHAFPIIQALGALFKTYLLPIIEDLYAFYVSTLIPALDQTLAWCKKNIPPVIDQIVEWVQTKLLPVLQVMIAWLQANVIPVIQKIASWIKGTLIPAIGMIITWVKEKLLPAVMNVLSWISEKVGSFFTWFVGVFQSTSDKTSGIWEKIKGFFKSAWDYILSVWEACQPFFQGVWDGVILPVADMVEEMIGAFQMAWDVIVLVWRKCQPFFSVLWEGIKIAATALGAALTAVFVTTWEYIKVVWGSVGPYFKSLWETLKAIFSVVKTFWGGFFKSAWEYIKAVWNVAIDFFTMVWAGIKAVFAVVKGVLSGDFSDAWESIKNIWNRAKEFFSSVWTGIKNVFGSVGSWFGNTFEAAWNAVKKAFASWESFFGNLWTTIKDKFSAIGTNISNAISDSVKSGLNGVISKIESVINSGVNMINGAINLINEIPGVSVGQLGKLSLPRLAKGGVVDSPLVAQIGENGAEAVVPLENNMGWLDKLLDRIADSREVQGAASTETKSFDAIIDRIDMLIEAVYEGQTIKINEREFARTVREYA